ncbi:peptidoglycan DD-metalloendopeptidase family protein [Weissella minor]|uniref:phage tail tip lysozyme n=1 Tax=Weissella minor TaxID=1620 RepID=UPI001BAE671A|nr:phage tail tip lysozyme [Weissella minor]MBS0949214.1 peptidoglycan DD-metalloendopeptidase family protein [Weissella minor]
MDDDEQVQANDQSSDPLNHILKLVAINLSWIIPLGVLLLAVFLIFIIVTTTTQESCSTDDPSSGMGAPGSASGDWVNKNSEKHKAMAYAAKELHEKTGMSGENVSAALAEGLRESQFDPKSVNPAGGVKGIWQWGAGDINGNRYGNTEDTVESQVALAIKELKSTHSRTLSEMKGADIPNSVNAWATYFEGLPPGDAAQRKHEATVATARQIQKVFDLNYAGKIDLGNNLINNGDNVSKEGAASDLSSCSGNTSGSTASGLPIQGRYNVTGGYPNYDGKSGSAHYGTDFQTTNHDGEAGNVYAVADGKVVSKSFDPVGGNHVVIKTVGGDYTYYGHAPSLSMIVVSVGNNVKKGQHISHQGQTGLATGVHVHFGVNTKSANFAPGAPGLESPGDYLKNVPRQVVPEHGVVVSGGPFNAK